MSMNSRDTHDDTPVYLCPKPSSPQQERDLLTLGPHPFPLLLSLQPHSTPAHHHHHHRQGLAVDAQLMHTQLSHRRVSGDKRHTGECRVTTVAPGTQSAHLEGVPELHDGTSLESVKSG